MRGTHEIEGPGPSPDWAGRLKDVASQNAFTRMSAPWAPDPSVPLWLREAKAQALASQIERDMSKGFWPAIGWFPTATGTKGSPTEVDIFEGGNISGSIAPNNCWEGNIGGGSSQAAAQGYTWSQTFADAGEDLTAAFHVYRLVYITGESITWYLDGKVMKQITQAQMEQGIIAPSNYNLVITPQNGGSEGSWHSAGPGTGTIEIAEVSVYSL